MASLLDGDPIDAREFEAAFTQHPLGPAITMLNPWNASPRPRANVHGKPPSWQATLRLLLPESCGAPSAAARERVWQRVVSNNKRSKVLANFEDLLAYILLLCRQQGIIGEGGGGGWSAASSPGGANTPSDGKASRADSPVTVADGASFGGGGPVKIEQFVRVGLEVAADMAGLERRAFRLLLMRFHQFLDVTTVLHRVRDPMQSVRFNDFERLLRERPHVLSLRQSGKVYTREYLFYNGLCAPGTDHIMFQALAAVSSSRRRSHARPCARSRMLKSLRPCAHGISTSQSLHPTFRCLALALCGIALAVELPCSARAAWCWRQRRTASLAVALGGAVLHFHLWIPLHSSGDWARV
jgi:hypothetical protein